MNNQRAVSSFTPCSKYDVFLNFRGIDTRKKFTDHLFHALKGEGINVFRDDDELEQGKPTAELLQAIEQSRISVTIFSTNYASSFWCLDELVKIVERMEAGEHTILPVFYNVEPGVVSNQEGEYKEAFVYHERENKEKVQNWRNAMREVANLAGWHVKDRYESEVIEEIVKRIRSELPLPTSMNHEHLVGISSHKEQLMKLIKVEPNDVRMIGICGRRGIGKTTIATVIYETISDEFKFQKRFLADVGENFKKDGGVSLQKQLIHDILKKKYARVPNSIEGKGLMKTMPNSQKVLIIIDDVDDINQLKALAGEHKWFPPGSRIIITTRDEHLLNFHGVNEVYKVEQLNHDDSMQLFSLKAFRKIQPLEDYMELSKHFVKYAVGVPLALEVLGSFLFGRSIDQWMSELERLSKEPKEAIFFNILQRSFDGLKESEQKIFLDVACFYKGEDKDDVQKIWEACDFKPTIGISVLIEKCLINIRHNQLWIHDLLQEMGRQMVKKKSFNEIGTCSRLWEAEEIRDVLDKKRGTEAIEGIQLDMSKIKEIDLNPDAFAKMCNLRIFDFCCMNDNIQIKNPTHFWDYDQCSCNEENSVKVIASQPLEFASCDLAYFRWHRYPLKALPSSFNPKKLVALVLPHSEVEELWDGIQPLGNLQYINLSHSKHLTKIPDLSLAPNLEGLMLKGCTSLIEIPSSIQNLNKLERVNLSGCSNLNTPPTFPCSIRVLSLDGTAISEYHLPDDLGKLEDLDEIKVDGTAIREVPVSISRLTCESPELHFLSALSSSRFLSFLNLTGCKIRVLPNSLGQLFSVRNLYLDKNNFERIPATIKDLSNLKFLTLRDCQKLQSLPELPDCLNVDMQNCVELEELTDLSFLFSPLTFDDSCPSQINLANCFKLNVNALGNKVKDHLLRVQQSAFNRTIGSHICYPGNKIPEWFPNQNEGSSMIIKLPPDWNNKNFLGFATGAVVESPYDADVECVCYTKDGEGCHYRKLNVCCIADNYSMDIQEDHVFLGFIWEGSEYMEEECEYFDSENMEEESEYFDLIDSNQAYIKFSAVNGFNTDVEYEVKRCGFHLVYAEDSGKAMEEKEEEISNSENNDLQVKYDVFLNFRGEDTGDNFTSHLHAALCRSNIEAFIDNGDGKLVGQDKTSSYLLNAIEESMISIIIFSEGYASSRCCLEELVKILECEKRYGQVVIPVFYYVDPSHVRNQTGIFGNAFAKLEECFKDQLETRLTWRIALREAANLPGFVSNAIRYESDLVDEIVRHVLKLLNNMYPSASKALVGVQSSIEKIKSLTCVGLKDVCIVGIWGISGIGKTTIARAVFEEIHSQFEASYFAPNVREQYESPDRITFLQQELLSKLLNDRYLGIGFTFIKQRLARKKVLIVFDDVTSLEQIKLLIGDFSCLGVGSRIIITTRYKQVLKNCGVDDDNMYLVEALFHREALQLFSWYAFQQNRPIVGYYELSNKIVQYINGVPLALKVLGSFFLGKTRRVWESAIDKLKRVPNKDILMMLKVSYDGLDDDEKNIFLDIACFLKWEERNFVIKFLDVSGFFAEIGVSVLMEKCLITVSNNKITMHDLLQEMGWEIVKKESIEDPGRRSRLWYHKDIYNVLKNNMGTKAIEGVCLDMSKITRIDLNHGAFAEMHNLRFLKVYNSHCQENNINKVHVPRDSEFVFTELRYLCWHGCPLESLELNFQSENLVALDMPNSNVEQLWAGDQHFDNLKHINLSHSKHLLKILDLSVAPNLETLILEGCTNLSEIASSKCLAKLVILNLRQCKSLHSLPMRIQSKSLRKVILSCCSNLKMFPEVSGDIEELFLDETGMEELPSSVGNLSTLVTLNLKDCSYLEKLPSNFCQLKSLEHLTLSGCSKLNGLPDCLGNLKALKVLEAGRFPMREVLSSIFNLSSLMELNLTGCDIMELPSSLGQLWSLESLLLGRNKFESIPTSIINLLKLSYLDLSCCERLRSLPPLPDHLQYFGAQSCTSLEASPGLSIWLRTVSRNARFNFINCFRLDQNALINIVKDVLQQIQDTPIDFCPRPNSYICFPGTEIPEWFTSQHMGSSIKFQLPLGGFNPGLVSFAVCAIVEFGNYYDEGQGLVVGCVCKLGSRVGTVVMYYDIGSHPVDSDHIILGYDLYMCSFDFNESRYNGNNKVSIQFYVEDLNNKRIDYCEVKKCGVHLLYYPKIGNLAEVKVHESKRLKRA